MSVLRVNADAVGDCVRAAIIVRAHVRCIIFVLISKDFVAVFSNSIIMIYSKCQKSIKNFVNLGGQEELD